MSFAFVARAQQNAASPSGALEPAEHADEQRRRRRFDRSGKIREAHRAERAFDMNGPRERPTLSGVVP